MAELAKPIAARLQKPSWRDTRLIVGVVLVLLSMALGAKLVAAADDTVPMYAAATALVPGQPVTQDDVKRVDVQLAGDRSSYVAADHDITAGTFALREVRPGELLPASALGDKGAVAVKPVTVPADTEAAGLLIKGSIVDVWVNQRDPGSTAEKYGKPVRTLESASVARAPEVAGSRLGAAAGTAGVQILVPDESVQDLIAAIDQGAKLTLVPVPGSPLKVAS